MDTEQLLRQYRQAYLRHKRGIEWYIRSKRSERPALASALDREIEVTCGAPTVALPVNMRLTSSRVSC